VFFEEFHSFEGEVEQFPERVILRVEDDPSRVVARFAAFQAERFTAAERDQDAGEVRVDLREQSRNEFFDFFTCERFAFGSQFEFVCGEVFFAEFFAFVFKAVLAFFFEFRFFTARFFEGFF